VTKDEMDEIIRRQEGTIKGLRSETEFLTATVEKQNKDYAEMRAVLAAMKTHQTVELCSQDRARLDKICEELEAVDLEMIIDLKNAVIKLALHIAEDL